MNTPERDYELFELGDFELHKGGVLPGARLAYRTHGKLSAAKDNAIVFPSWFSSTHRNNEWLIGPGRALDPERHFIVCPNLFGNGLSSSPSNTAPPFDRIRFPLVTVLDNVRAQQRLVMERFGIQRLELVLGRSMGAQTAFQWGSWYPEAVARLMPFCGSAKTTPHNAVFLESVRATLTADAAWNGGEYSSPPEKGIRAVGRLYASWAMSQGFYREGLHLREGDKSIQEYLEKRWDGNFFRSDANDLLAMLATWQVTDIADNARFGGDWPAALAAIRCPSIVMPSRTDLYFPPEDSAAAVAHMPKAELRVIESLWGHRAGSPNSDPRDIAFIDQAIRDLLARPA
jgi:homoserine O-acetyltransferase